MHICHDRSVRVCLIRYNASHCIASHRFGAMRHFRSLLVRWRVGSDYFLVLVFAATRNEMALLYPCPSRRNQHGKQNVEIIDL